MEIAIRWRPLLEVKSSLIGRPRVPKRCPSLSLFTSYYELSVRFYRSKVEITVRYRRLAQVTTLFDRPISVFYWFSLDIHRSSRTVYELEQIFEAIKLDCKWKSPLGGAA
jgi:hypothetical protein